MMKQLVAVNEKLAVYRQNRSSLEKPVNTRRYLSNLLKIRSAAGLIKFLRDFPQNLSGAMDEDLIHYCDSIAIAPRGDFAFSHSVMENAARKLGVSPFDAVTEFDDDREAYPSESFCVVEIEKLERFAEQIRQILNMALTYYGHGSCSSMFASEQREGYVLLSISREDVDSMFPGIFARFDNYMNALGPDVTRVGSTVSLFPAEGRYLFKTDGNVELAIREAAGIITSQVLTKWLNHFDIPTRIMCSGNGDLELRDSEIREVPMELARIVMEKRIGICNQCGNPFIVIRADKNDTESNHFCGPSCSTQNSNDRRNNG